MTAIRLDEIDLHPDVGKILLQTISFIESAFGDHTFGYYLFGSQREGLALSTSDIDLFLVVDPPLDPEDVKRRVKEELPNVALDLVVFSSEKLRQEGHFRIESCSTLIYGRDIRPEMPKTTISGYMRSYTQAPISYMSGVLRGGARLVYPVGPPNPSVEFLGYPQATMPPGGEPIENIKALVALVCWIASVTVSFRTGSMIGSKPEAVSRFLDLEDDWRASFVSETYRFGHDELGYLMPISKSDRDRLARLCQQMPELENTYLIDHRAYLVSELESNDDEGSRIAQERLANFDFS